MSDVKPYHCDVCGKRQLEDALVVMHLASGIWFLCADGKGGAACLPASLLPPKRTHTEKPS